MISIPFNRGKSFINFARTFVGALAAGDFTRALSHLDADDDGRRWDRSSLEQAVAELGEGQRLTDPDMIRRSAEAEFKGLDVEGTYLVLHRLPVNGKWSDHVVIFEFEKRKSHFRVILQQVGDRRL